MSGRAYRRSLRIGAPRERVFAALATVDGVRGWWTAGARGSAGTGGELRLGFAGMEEEIRLRVERAERPAAVRWACVAHTGAPDWDGSTISFELLGDGEGRCELRFSHVDVPREQVERGWRHFHASLAAYAESGAGMPFEG